jgi:PPOX class probable FMN-dependent enzyme
MTAAAELAVSSRFVAAADPQAIESAQDMWAIVGDPLPRVLEKESASLNERSRGFVAASPFFVLATTGADGSCDASPKGGPAGFVKVLDEARLLIPEFSGNRRFDGLQNLLERPNVGLLFMVPGITETLRVNGVARVTREPELLAACAVDGRTPWFALDVAVKQAFNHCSKAFLRAGLWQPESWPDPNRVPSPSRTTAERAIEEGRSEVDVRQETERAYEPELY